MSYYRSLIFQIKTRNYFTRVMSISHISTLVISNSKQIIHILLTHTHVLHTIPHIIRQIVLAITRVTLNHIRVIPIPPRSARPLNMLGNVQAIDREPDGRGQLEVARLGLVEEALQVNDQNGRRLAYGQVLEGRRLLLASGTHPRVLVRQMLLLREELEAVVQCGGRQRWVIAISKKINYQLHYQLLLY